MRVTNAGPQAAGREPVGDQNRLPNMPYVF